MAADERTRAHYLTAGLLGRYDYSVRWTLALTVLASFSFSLIAPAAFAASRDSSLPSCCRRNGAHDCEQMAAASAGPAIQSARCPFFPSAGVATASPAAALLAPPGIVPVSIASSPARGSQNESPISISFRFTCYKRGPPIQLS
jgi:hypothetical protein